MSKIMVMGLADAYAEVSFDQGLDRAEDDQKPGQARAALQAEVERMDEAIKLALVALASAASSIQDWGCYASAYYQEQHDLQGDIDEVNAAIAKLREVQG